MNRGLLLAALAWVLATGPSLGHGQAVSRWPAVPLRIVVPAQPGSPSDVVARLIAERLGARSGQPVVVDNKVGANGMIGMREAAKADADGGTIVIGQDTIVTVNPVVYAGRGFDPREAFVAVSVLTSTPQVLVCNPESGIATWAQLVEQGRQRPVLFASGGIGSPGHLSEALMADAAGIRTSHVPYRGPGTAVTGVLGGEVACGFLTSSSVLPHVKAGRLRALAVSSLRPSTMAPEIKPLAAQIGLPSFDASFMTVAWVPKDTAAPLRASIARALQDVGADATLREKLAAQDQAVVFNAPAQARQVLDAAADRWAPIVRRLELKPD